VDWGLASGTPLSRARYALSWSWIGRRAGVLHSGALWRGRVVSGINQQLLSHRQQRWRVLPPT